MIKKPLVHTLKWWTEKSTYAAPAPRLQMKNRYTDGRSLRGVLGVRMLALGAEGKLTFLDTAPGFRPGHVLLVGIRAGVLATYFGYGSASDSELIPMCPGFRNRLVGLNKLRWAKVKATASVEEK